MKKIVFLSMLPLFLFGCMSARKLQNQLNKDKYFLAYLHDSPKVKEKSELIIDAEVVDLSDSSSETTVHENDKSFMWLLFYAEYNLDCSVNLGKNSLTPQLSEFVKNSLSKEIARSSNFTMKNENPDYRLRLEITDLSSKNEYHREEIGFGNTKHYSVNITPARAFITLNAKVFDKQGNIVFTKKYTNQKKMQFLDSYTFNLWHINSDLMNNLTEALSECIKVNVSNIVLDLNQLVERKTTLQKTETHSTL